MNASNNDSLSTTLTAQMWTTIINAVGHDVSAPSVDPSSACNFLAQHAPVISEQINNSAELKSNIAQALNTNQASPEQLAEILNANIAKLGLNLTPATINDILTQTTISQPT